MAIPEEDRGRRGGFSGIDPARLKAMIDSLERGSEVLRRAKSQYRERFLRYAVPTDTLDELGAVGMWAHDQLPMLKRRQNLAAALAGHSPGVRRVEVREPSMTSAEARATGAELAGQLNALGADDGEVDRGGIAEVHDVARVLQNYADDPDVLAAFYARLDPGWFEVLPGYFAQAGEEGESARHFMGIYGQTLGVALSADYPPPGLDRVRRLFLSPPDSQADAWSRGCWLQRGRFPSAWLARVARANVLDGFAADPEGGSWRGDASTVRTLGYPANTAALYLNALAADPDAVRTAFFALSAPLGARDLMRTLMSYRAGTLEGDEVADALGAAIEAGAGVGVEDPGEHRLPSARLAMAAIVAMGEVEDFPPAAKDSMSRLAISYQHEIASGGRMDVAEDRDSALSAPEYWVEVPGLTPSFYLGPQDTYRFLKTFASHDAYTDPFDEAMGTLRHDVLVRAARADAAAVRAREQDPERFELTSRAFGDTAGLEYQAQLTVRGEMDAHDQRTRELYGTVLTAGLNRVPAPEGLVAKLGWMAGKYVAGQGIQEIVEIQPEDTRVGQVDASRDQVVYSAKYELARALFEAGYPYPDHRPPPDELLDGGSLQPYLAVAADGHLDIFESWSNSTGFDLQENEIPASFDAKLEDGIRGLSNSYSGVHVRRWEAQGEQ